MILLHVCPSSKLAQSYHNDMITLVTPNLFPQKGKMQCLYVMHIYDIWIAIYTKNRPSNPRPTKAILASSYHNAPSHLYWLWWEFKILSWPFNPRFGCHSVLNSLPLFPTCALVVTNRDNVHQVSVREANIWAATKFGIGRFSCGFFPCKISNETKQGLLSDARSWSRPSQ